MVNYTLHYRQLPEVVTHYAWNGSNRVCFEEENSFLQIAFINYFNVNSMKEKVCVMQMNLIQAY